MSSLSCQTQVVNVKLHVKLHVELACQVVMPCKANSQGTVFMQSLVTSQVTIRVEL
jgi:hypothetical protein